MVERFDPSAFIAAEQQSQAVASSSDDDFGWGCTAKPPENREILHDERPVVAEIAAVAAPASEFPWSDGLRHLEALECPGGMRPEDWDELVNEAVLLSRYWGAKAIACGWTTLDLFGCNPNPTGRRLDRDGLAIGIAGFAVPLKIVAIDEKAATLNTPRGDVLRHYRFPKIGQVPLWEAYSPTTGP